MPDFTPRPTVYKGIQMRSRLEAGFAQWLDGWDLSWEYEPCAFGSHEGQYLPDFRLTGLYVSRLPDPVVAYVEVKPTDEFIHDVAKQMAVIWDSEPTAALMVQYPRIQTPLAPGMASTLVLDREAFPEIGPVWRRDLLIQGPDRCTTEPWRPSLMLAHPLRDTNGPWPDNWWQVVK